MGGRTPTAEAPNDSSESGLPHQGQTTEGRPCRAGTQPPARCNATVGWIGREIEQPMSMAVASAADSAHAPGSFAPTTTDGRYTLRKELARGGMGRIWIADDARLGRRVAIKELLEPTAAQLARVDRELR